MTISLNLPWVGRLLLLLTIAIALTDAKKRVVYNLRRWESTGIVNCTAPKFACDGDPDRSISLSSRCDGYTDCSGYSDEANCTECRTPFAVNITGGYLKCLKADDVDNSTWNYYYRRSRFPSCVVEALEKMRESWKSGCAVGQLRCSIGPTCLASSSVCDGVEDCKREHSECHGWKGGEDEQNCTECRNGARMCAETGKCIKRALVCNGKKDCPDGSDEKDCTCESCSGSRALCANGECIHGDKVCDGVVDCKDASDEQGCTTSCGAIVTVNTTTPPTRSVKSDACSGKVAWGYCPDGECDPRLAFDCGDGRCIRKTDVCDGMNDCSDGSDEKDCLKACLKYPYFTCLNYRRVKCMSMDAKCDGVRDCTDGNDEKKCNSCSSDAIRCDGGCISGTKRCDGVKDCRDGSDERKCTCEECMNGRQDMYSCEATGKCLKRSAACGPHSLCPNPTARDELFCAHRR